MLGKVGHENAEENEARQSCVVRQDTKVLSAARTWRGQSFRDSGAPKACTRR